MASTLHYVRYLPDAEAKRRKVNGESFQRESNVGRDAFFCFSKGDDPCLRK